MALAYRCDGCGNIFDGNKPWHNHFRQVQLEGCNIEVRLEQQGKDDICPECFSKAVTQALEQINGAAAVEVP